MTDYGLIYMLKYIRLKKFTHVKRKWIYGDSGGLQSHYMRVNGD